MHNAHFYKFMGLGLVGITMVALIIWMDYRQRRRRVRIQLGGPDIPSAPVLAESVDDTPDGSNSNDEWQETSIADSTEAPETDQQHQNLPESEHSRT